MAKVQKGSQKGNSKGTDMQVSGREALAKATEMGFDKLLKKSQEMQENARFNKDNKDELIGQPFLILTVSFKESDRYTSRDGEPGAYVSCQCMLPDGTTFLLSDGSTGIAAQLDEWVNQHGLVISIESPLYCPKGLRVSTYDKPELGIKGAQTYYLTGRSSASEAIARNREGARNSNGRSQARA